LSHNGGKASAGLIAAHEQFAPVATTAALGVKEVPVYRPPVLGQSVDLELRGMYGFSDIVLRIIATYDLDLSDRPGALLEVDRRLGQTAGPARARVDDAKQDKRINGLLRQASLPSAVHTPAFTKFLKDTGRIPDYWK
jgi:hypothetical protein